MRILERGTKAETSPQNLSAQFANGEPNSAGTKSQLSPPGARTSVLEQLSAAAQEALEALPKNGKQP
jgi:hypothetical protein